MENENKLPPDFKAKWVAALRSGEYEQGRSNLHWGGKFCCLGVACVVASIPLVNLNNWSLIPNHKEFKEIPEILHDGYGDDVGLKLAAMNDNNKSFTEIAQYIEENL